METIRHFYLTIAITAVTRVNPQLPCQIQDGASQDKPENGDLNREGVRGQGVDQASEEFQGGSTVTCT